jgi:antitoxin component YwqK of YwqJK toxin-antitoxin module
MIWNIFSFGMWLFGLYDLGYEGTDKSMVVPEIAVISSDHDLRQSNGVWQYHGVNFSGYIVEKNGLSVISKIPVLHGREHGTALGWYKNGKKKYERNYMHGDREGYHWGWYENNRVAFEYKFHQDQFDGDQKTYFESGHIWQWLHYVNGYEEGKQKSWNDSGRVINNFTVKNGKLYGVIGRYDCMSVIKK